MARRAYRDVTFNHSHINRNTMKLTVPTLCILSLAVAVHAGHPGGKKRRPGSKPKVAYIVNPKPGTPRPMTTPRPFATPVPLPTPRVKTPIGLCP